VAIRQQTNRFYEFGPFRINSVGRILLRGGEVVQLTPKEFDILLLLVESRGEVVEKERLIEEIWPDTAVEEGNLTTNISTLRKALAEGSNGQQYIQTLPRRGYRFVGQVSEVVDDGALLVVEEHARSQIVIEQEVEDGRTSAETRGDKTTKAIAESRRLRVSASALIALATVLLLAVSAAVLIFLMMNKPVPTDTTAKTIAVLPFKPLVADSRNESLELGMADTLINKLSGIKQLIVRPISDVRRYAKLEQDPIAAGRQLGVDYVLEGNLQTVDEKTRATMRLLSVKDGSAIWTDKCDEQCSSVFELQDAIAERIAVALALKLSGDERTQLAKHYTDSPEAYQLYTLGVAEQDTKKKVEYFERAIKIDPNYALAYHGIYLAYFGPGTRGFYISKEDRLKSEWAAMRAAQIDETLPQAHTALGNIKKYYWDWAGAEKEFKRALELDPNFNLANSMYMAFLVDTGRAEEALPYARRVDELGRNIAGFTPGLEAYVYYHLRQYDKAIELWLKWKKPGGPKNFQLAEAYLANGMYEEGIAEMQEVVAADNAPERWDRLPILAYAYAVAGRRDEALKILDEQKRLAKQKPISAYSFAIIYTGLGDKDRAFEYLNKACDEHAQPMYHFPYRPMFDRLHSDPRYAELLRRMNLPV
jgi:DNA-binding winged helix-turn-helix (wHTH) protein/TolB-like protein